MLTGGTSRRRNMVLVALVGFSFFFSFNQFVLLPLYLEEAGMQPGEIGGMLSVLFLSAMLSRFFIGVVAARIGVRQLGIVSAGGWVVSSAMFLTVGPDTLWMVYPLRAVQGITCAGLDLMVTLIPSELSPQGRRAQGIGVVSVFFVIGWAISPPVAEWLMVQWGFFTVFLMSIVSGVVALMATLALRLPASSRYTRPYRMNLTGAWRVTFDRGLVYICLATFVAIGLTEGAFMGFIPLFSTHQGLGAGSMFFFFGSIASVVVRALFSGLSDRWGRRQVLVPAFIIAALVPILLYNPRTMLALIMAGIIYGVANGLQMPAIIAYVTERRREGADPSLALGLFFSSFDGGTWIGMWAFGYLAESIQFGPAFLSLILCNLLGLGMIFFLREGAAIRSVGTVQPSGQEHV